MGIVRRWMWMLAMVVMASLAFADEMVYEETYDVEEGAWLEIDCPTGTITIDSWEQDRVELVAYHEPDAEVRSRKVRGDVQVGSASEKRRNQPIDYEVRVPVWLNVGVAGNHVEVEIRGVNGRIEVETIDGDVFVKGGREKTVLQSIKGDIRLEGAEGEIGVESADGDVTVIDSKGTLIVAAVNGDVRCENVVSSMVEVETLQGDILFDGALADEGDYYFTTHTGEIELSVPRDVNLAVTAVTYHGEFATDFDTPSPDRRRGVAQQRWAFEIGAGTGTLRAESFQGDIELFSSKRGRGKRD